MSSRSELRKATPAPRLGVVVFAHTPPPRHGQSFMVSLMLDGLESTTLPDGEPAAPRTIHINCRYSEDIRQMGRAGSIKILRALGYALKAMLARFRFGAATLYYIPAPGKRPAFLRDCLVLAIVRPFFRRTIFHWHAAGLAPWLEGASPLERWLGHRLLGRSDLSIVLVEEKRSELAPFSPREVRVIPNGIPDPCPELSSQSVRRDPDVNLRLLFLSTASREKGVFDAIAIWHSLNQRSRAIGGAIYDLAIAGLCPNPDSQRELDASIDQARKDVEGQTGPRIDLLGDVRGDQKAAAFQAADIFLFPSIYPCESFGLVLIEAAFFGLPCVTYQPLVGPNGLSPRFHRRVPMGDVDAAVSAVESLSLDHRQEIRQEAVEKYNSALFCRRMREVFREFQS